MASDNVFLAADQMWWILPHRPEALEGFDEKLPELARIKKYPGVKLLPNGRAFLIAEFGGESREEAHDRAEKMMAQARYTPECVGIACIEDPAQQNAVWKIRESGLGSGAYFPGLPRTWPGAEDLAVPPAKLGPVLRRFAEVLERNQLQAGCYYGHFGEGCVHARINFDLASAKGIATFRSTMEELADAVVECGGSLSGEHGDGLARSELLPKMYNAKLIEAFGEFKKIFDPDNMMNPGNLVDPFPLDSHLKQGAQYRPLPLKTHFDFSADEGLAGAALRCVGIGKCRKTDAGSMCPSYMATREEMHSTRGRARILYEALAGETLDSFTDSSVHKALDLCMSCKSCKSECPSSVDMATYKAEFLAHYYEKNPRPRSAKLFSNIHELAQRYRVPAPRQCARQRPDSFANRQAHLRHSSAARVPATRPPHLSRVVRESSRLDRPDAARGSAVPRYLHQLLRSRRCDRGDRGFGARQLPRRDSRRGLMLRASAL